MSMNKNIHSSQAEEKIPAASDSEKSRLEARRDFLKKAGKFALYTPPALSLLMYPSMQAIAKSGGGRGRAFGRKIARLKSRGRGLGLKK